MRQEYSYLKRRERLRKAIIGIGLENDDVDKLVGNMKLDGLEELMLATYSMLKHIRKHLTDLGLPYTEQLEVVNLHVALHLTILLYDRIDSKNCSYVPLSDEADKMEMISRAAYCWLKTHRMLKHKKPEQTRFDLIEVD